LSCSCMHRAHNNYASVLIWTALRDHCSRMQLMWLNAYLSHEYNAVYCVTAALKWMHTWILVIIRYAVIIMYLLLCQGMCIINGEAVSQQQSWNETKIYIITNSLQQQKTTTTTNSTTITTTTTTTTTTTATTLNNGQGSPGSSQS